MPGINSALVAVTTGPYLMPSQTAEFKTPLMSSEARRFPIGAEPQPGGGVHFRVWAPTPESISLVIEDGDDSRDVSLEPEGGGYFSRFIPEAAAGTRYRYRLDGDLLPDPASRYQPDGPFGPSQVVDPRTYEWTTGPSQGLSMHGQIIYEMHVGTFTPEGTWRSAATKLPLLAQTGITVLEVMPVSEFPGRFGWGYDGVFPYAPTRLYGTPDDFRAFIDTAHQHGLFVILDVVYNHLGPDGCVFGRFSTDYFSRDANEWGQGLNFDGENSDPVREYFSSNAAYWIDEYRLDGLRLDATQSMRDTSDEHVLTVIGRRARDAAKGRAIILVAENEPQHVRLVRPAEDGGYGLDALWNDDFHHSAFVAMTGNREAYFSDHHGTPQELVSAAKFGYLFQGQRYAWQKQPRGTRADGVDPAVFVNFIENHDQLANSGDGSRMRMRTTPGRYRAMSALFILMPGTPMLFQGQEFGASAPFLFFADHRPELAEAVQKGRAEFLTQFPSLASPEMQRNLPLPHDPKTWERTILDWREYDTHVEYRRLYTDLLALRRSERAIAGPRGGTVDGAVLAPEAFVLHYFAGDPADERLLCVNLGPDLVAGCFAEPLVAPPDGFTWQLRWSSEDPDYGGAGMPPVVGDDGWRIHGHSAVVLQPVASEWSVARGRP
jgi:maltooligosyltrehalose trehalohydrolase